VKIGIDARQLSGLMIGTRRALESVLKEWLRVGLNGHEIFLYSPRKIELSFLHPFHCRVGSSIGKVIGGTLWLQTELPFLVRQDALDVFWATTDIIPLPLVTQMPCLLTVQDLGYYNIPRHLSLYVRFVYRLFFRKSIRAAARVICTTSAVKEDLRRLGFQGEKIQVVHHGVDLNSFSIQHQNPQMVTKKYDLNSPFFLFVGHLRPNKNLERTLLAFNDFLLKTDVTPKPFLVLVGGRTKTDSSIFHLMKDTAIKDHVRYLSYVSDEDLPALYQAALGFVSPAIYEGFGLPYLEAMAAGLPIIAPNIPTVSEICGDAAIYVDPFSVESISTGLNALCQRTIDRDYLRQKALERVKHFTWAHTAKQIMEALESLVETNCRLALN
jgi:glycosyltransferase involved in cell wall biosynthesis